MTNNRILKVFAALISGGIMLSANANSISFDMDPYIAIPQEQVAVTVYFDFTDFGMFGGGFNVIYDANVLEFVGYTQAVFSGPGAPQVAASPIGGLNSPGNYLGAGVGTFEFFTGNNTAGDIGTFVFTVLGAGGDGGCGATLCLTPVVSNPMVSLAGENVTASVLANGIAAAVVLTDTDGDGLADGIDNCPDDPNALQENNDGDSEGDVCDPDDDNDVIGDELDAQPFTDSNECTGGDDINATLQRLVLVELTCAARETITVLPFTNIQDPGDLHLIAPLVIFHSDIEATKLDVIAEDSCPGCSVCGNGILEAPEQCDDGNLTDGDGCSAVCLIE